jgi:hypothetical protein
MKSIKIEVIGSGCKKCKALFDLTKEVTQELGIKEPVKYSIDVSKIAIMGVMSSPVLAINDKPILVGILPDKEKLRQIISENIFGDLINSNIPQNNKKSDGCSCGGNC